MKRVILAGVLALTCLGCGMRSRAAVPEFMKDEERSDVGGEPDSVAVSPTDSVAFTVKPRLLNAQALKRAIAEAYPRHLKEAGIGGVTVVHLFVNVEGRVQNKLVKRSSGNAGLDNAALRALAVAMFMPARKGHQRVALWIELTITFRANRSQTNAPPGSPKARGQLRTRLIRSQ